MVSKIGKLLFLFGILGLLSYGCDSSSDRTVNVDKPDTVSGKAVQTYVRGATIIADKVGADSVGNFGIDSGETHSFSGTDGSFSIEIPHGYGGYVLFTNGGSVISSSGMPEAAIPMLAPQGARNITPITTLVALCPELKTKIGSDYDADIASAAGVPGYILQLAKTVEGVVRVFTDPYGPTLTTAADQLAVVKKLALAFADSNINIKNDVDILAAVTSAMGKVFADNDIINDQKILANASGITSSVTTCVQRILAAVSESATAAKEDIALLKETEYAVQDAIDTLHTTTLAFSPSASIIPFPNDIAWQSGLPADRIGLVTLDPSTASDLPTQALYTAINSLKLKGLSPNTTIGIPLDRDTNLSSNSLDHNIKVVNLSTLFGVLYGALKLGDPTTTAPDVVKTSVVTSLAKIDAATWELIKAGVAQYAPALYANVRVMQDGNYIKIYPLGPLAANAAYLVYIEDKANDTSDDFIDIYGGKVKEAPFYKFLKSTQPLTGSLAALEPLRQNYALIYNYLLKALGLNKEDTLEIFTFTTAEKTLSLTDAGIISAAITANDLTLLSKVSGLPYSQITGEYATFDNALKAKIKGSPTVAATAFASFDITTLQNQAPTAVNVPYTVINGGNYTDTVVMFQHGLGGQKEHAAYFATAVDLPVIAMDLPLHGARAIAGKAYLSTDMLTTRLNLYQSVFDMTMMLQSLKNGQFDINADGKPDKPAEVYYAGISLGSITGSILSAYNAIDKVALSVGGANFAGLVDQVTNAEITSGFSFEKNNTQYFVTLGVLQCLIDPADPAYLANPKFNGKTFNNPTLIQTAYMDTVVPNICNEILATVIGYSYWDMIEITDFTEAAPIELGWYQYGGKDGMKANWINHGFLLNPVIDGYTEAAGYLDQNYVNGAYAMSRAQIDAFFMNP